MKKIFLSVIMLITIISTASVALASNNPRNKQEATEKADNSAVQVDMVGEEGSYLILKVSLRKHDDRAAMLRITDGLGEVLYTERVSLKSAVRYVKVAPDEINKMEVVFERADGTTRKTYALEQQKFTRFGFTEVAGK